MKYIITSALLLSLTSISFAEGVGIAETEITADPSAMLEVASTNKGALFPRMTTGQRLAIPSPATGLLVYDTDEDAFFYKGEPEWMNLSAPEEPIIAFHLKAAGTIHFPTSTFYAPPLITDFIEGNCITNGTEFVAPVSGIYALNSSAVFSSGSGTFLYDIRLLKNGNNIGRESERRTHPGGTASLSVNTTVKLNSGDKCTVQVYCAGTGSCSLESLGTHFSGHLVKALE